MNAIICETYGSVTLSGRLWGQSVPTYVQLITLQGHSGFVSPSCQAVTQSVLYTPPLRKS
ncbi:hypothetical protein IV102_05850 [bacterium]|nr:hypothetical protein [bacterium]